MNYERIYQYHFKGVDKSKKLSTWKLIADFIYKKCNAPLSILDPAAGDCEFINAVPSKERWAIDRSHNTTLHADNNVNVIIGSNFSVDPEFLPLSFRRRIPVTQFLVKAYLMLLFAWKLI